MATHSSNLPQPLSPDYIKGLEKDLGSLLLRINENYTNYDVRKMLIYEALSLANKIGYEAGIRVDTEKIRDPYSMNPEEYAKELKEAAEWPIATIVLKMERAWPRPVVDYAQVSWHMPCAKVLYDAHTPQQCRDRCTEYANLHNSE